MGRSAVKSKLPDSYGKKFDQMLLDISESSERRSFREKGFTAFWPMKGKHFVQDHGLMIVGRAVNGWTEEAWTPLKVADQSKRERKRIVNGIRELSESKDADRWKYSHDRVVNLRRGVEIEISNSDCPLSLIVQNAGAKKNKENAGPKADYNTN